MKGMDKHELLTLSLSWVLSVSSTLC